MIKSDIFIGFIIAFVIFICIYMYYDNRESFQLKCIVSDVDGNKYCVRERDRLNDAADLLANVSVKCGQLVAYVGDKYPDLDNVKRLVAKYNPKKIMETLPTSEYTAYSENKGEKLAFCLNKKKDDDTDLIDPDTLLFVAIHELSHVMTVSIGHEKEFWDNFKFLLENAKESGIHDPVDYKKKPKEYCSMKIHDSPYYDI